MTIFAVARPAEILRAGQKDEIIKRSIRSSLSDIIFKVAGSQTFVRYHEGISVLGDILYGVTTTLSGLQTLGEEYTAIVQVTTGLRNIPSLARRILIIILTSGGNLLIVTILKHLKQSVKKNENIRCEAKKSIIEFIGILENTIPLILLSHKALFYFTGTFYDFPKRLTGVHYVLIHRWLREEQPLYGFKVLGFAAVLHILLQALSNSKQWWQNQKLKVEEATIENTYSVIKYKCPLCMDNLKQPSTTLCGHLYCWNCVLDWSQANQRCPVCRVNIIPSRIIPLKN